MQMQMHLYLHFQNQNGPSKQVDVNVDVVMGNWNTEQLPGQHENSHYTLTLRTE